MLQTQQRRRHMTCDEIHRFLRIPTPRTYQSFLKSKYWFDCKQRVLQRDGCCQACGGRNALEVHHKTYEHHGDEMNHLDDLTALCPDCHAACHRKPGRRRNGMESLGSVISRQYWQGVA